MAHLTIVPEDKVVSVGGIGHGGLDFSSCNIPSNVNALQWDGTSGWIEFTTPIENEPITELPAWAIACKNLWQAVEDTPEPPPIDFSLETFWGEQNYPSANIKDVEWLIANAPTGVTLTKMYDKFEEGSKIIGVHFEEVLSNATGDGLKGMNNTIQIANNIGVPCFASRSSIWSENFCRYLTESGWTIFEAPQYKTAYRVWTLDLHKIYKKRLINNQRDASIKNGYNDGTNTWDIDSQSMTNMTSKTIGLTDDVLVKWRTKANIDVTMTGAEFKTLVQNAVAAVDIIYQDSWTKKAAVDSATSRESVDII